MDEEALNSAYQIAKSKGYKKTIDDFKVLLGSDDEALNDIYKEVSKLGYKKDVNSFANLIGVKKKEESKLIQEVAKNTTTVSKEVAKPLQKSGVTNPVGGEEYTVEQVIDSYDGKKPNEVNQTPSDTYSQGYAPTIIDEAAVELGKETHKKDEQKAWAKLDRIDSYGSAASRRKLYNANPDQRQAIKDEILKEVKNPEAVDKVMNTAIAEYKKVKDDNLVSEIKTKTKNDIANSVIRKTVDSETYTPQIFRNDTPDIAQPLGFKEKKGVTYNQLNDEDKKKVAKEVEKEYAAKIDMKLWSVLSDEDKQLATNNTKQQTLAEKLKDENISTEQRNTFREQLMTLEKERNLLGASNKLYNPLTGQYVDKDDADETTTQYNKTFDFFREKFRTDKQITKKVAEDNILRLEGIENKVNEKVGGFYSKMTYKDLWNFGEMNVATNPNMKLSDWEYAQGLKTEYLDAKAKAHALAWAVETNQDPAAIKRGLFTESGGADAFEKGFMGGIGLEHKLEEQEEGAIATEFVNAMNEGGKEGVLTKAQIENAKETFSEKVMYGTGATLPVMGEIALTSIITEGVGGAIQVAKYLPTITKLFGSKKAASLFGGIMKETAKGYLTFAPTSLEGSEGIGEGFAQGVMNKVLPENLLKGKYGRILEFGMRIGAGATAETVQEYGGGYLKALKDNGYDMDVAFENTVGRTPEEAWEKLFLIGTQSLMFSGGFNAKVLYSTKAYLETKVEDGTIKGEEKEAVEEVIKKSNEKLASEPSTNTVVDNKTGKLTVVTNEEIEEKINDKQFLRDFVDGKVQVNINDNQELVDKLEKASIEVAKEVKEETLADIDEIISLDDSVDEDVEVEPTQSNTKVDEEVIPTTNEEQAETNKPIIDETETTTENGTTETDVVEEVDEVELAKRKTEFEDNKTKELQSLSDEEYVTQFIEDGHLNSINSKREFLLRPDFQLPTKDVQKGVADIKAGKNTAAARHLTAAILETKRTGVIPMVEGTGGTSNKTGRDLGSLYSQEVDIPADVVLGYDGFSLETKDAIKQGITLENIDSFKDEMFDGFPYTEEDFINIKKELENEKARTQTSNVGDSQVSNESESQQSKTTGETIETKRERIERELKESIQKLKKSNKLGVGGLQNLEELVNMVAKYVELVGVNIEEIIARIKKDFGVDIEKEQVNKSLRIIDSRKQVIGLVKGGKTSKEALEEVYNELVGNGVDITEKDFLKAFLSHAKEQKLKSETKKRLEAEQEVETLFEKKKEIKSEEIQTFLEGIRLGVNATKSEIKEVQTKIKDYATKVLPNTKYAKRELTKLSTLIKNTQTQKDVTKAIEKIDEIKANTVKRKRIADIQGKLKTVKSNLKNKFGDIYNQVKPLLELKTIPDNLLDEYESVVNMLSTREEVLPIDKEDLSNLHKKIVKLLEVTDDSLTEEQVAEKEAASLENAIKSYEKAKAELDEIDKFSIDEIAKLIGANDHLTDIKGKSKEEVKAITENIKKITALHSLITIDEDIDFEDVSFENKKTNYTALRFLDLVKSNKKYIATLPSSTINKIVTETVNIGNGYISNSFAHDTVKSFDNFIAGEQLFKSENRFGKAGEEESIDDFDGAGDKVRSTTSRKGLHHIDNYLGSIDNTAIYETLISVQSRAIAAKKEMLDGLTAQASKLVKKALISRMGKLAYKARLGLSKAEFKMNNLLDLYRAERMHQSNPNSTSTESIITILDKIINSEKTDKPNPNYKAYPSNYKKEDFAIFREIRESLVVDENGNVDLAKLKEQFTEEELALNDFIDEQYNGELGDIAEYVMNHINGESYEMHNNYTPMPVYRSAKDSDVQDAKLTDTLKQSSLTGKPRLKAGSSQEKTGAGNNLNRLGAVSNFLNYADEMLTNYHIAPAKKQVDGTLDYIHKTGNLSSQKISEVLKELLDLNLVQTLSRESDVLNPNSRAVWKLLVSNVVKKLLMSVERLAKDLSNFIVATPLAFRSKEQIQKSQEFNKSGAWNKAVKIHGTSQQGRSKGAFSQDFADASLSKAQRGGFKTAKTTIGKGVVGALTNNDLKDFGDFASQKYYEFIDVALSIQQRAKFLSHFKKITGKDFDTDKFMNDESYGAKFHNEIARSMSVADKNVSDLYNSVSKLEQKMYLKGEKATDIKPMLSNFMQSFTFNEQSVIFTAGKSIIGKSSMSKGEGAAKLAMIVSRMYVYDIIGGMTYRLIKDALPDDDEEKKKVLAKMYYDSNKTALGNFAMILVAGNLPAWAKSAISSVANEAIEQYRKEVLKMTKYERGKAGSYFFNQDFERADDVLKNFGASGNIIITFIDLGESLYDHVTTLGKKVKKGEKITYEDYIKLRSLQHAYNLLSTWTGIPLYKDVNGLQKILERESKGEPNKGWE